MDLISTRHWGIYISKQLNTPLADNRLITKVSSFLFKYKDLQVTTTTSHESKCLIASIDRLPPPTERAIQFLQSRGIDINITPIRTPTSSRTIFLQMPHCAAKIIPTTQRKRFQCMRYAVLDVVVGGIDHYTGCCIQGVKGCFAHMRHHHRDIIIISCWGLGR
jgi:hypothetical protein